MKVVPPIRKKTAWASCGARSPPCGPRSSCSVTCLCLPCAPARCSQSRAAVVGPRPARSNKPGPVSSRRAAETNCAGAAHPPADGLRVPALDAVVVLAHQRHLKVLRVHVAVRGRRGGCGRLRLSARDERRAGRGGGGVRPCFIEVASYRRARRRSTAAPHRPGVTAPRRLGAHGGRGASCRGSLLSALCNTPCPPATRGL
jgi:hypothetical protein